MDVGVDAGVGGLPSALTTVEACARSALTSAGLSENIMVLLFCPISEYMRMYCGARRGVQTYSIHNTTAEAIAV